MNPMDFDAAVNAALTKLDSVAATQEDIIKFVRQLSLDVKGDLAADAVTYLYAGEIDGTSAWKIIDKIDEANASQTRHIGKTVASAVMNSSKFTDKIAHGRALKGQKVHGLQSAFSRPRTRLMGAYCNNKLIAPMLFEGTCNSDLFHARMEQMLLPELVCGSVIVLDNAAFHTAKRTQRLVEQAGFELLFLPPYSPDLNPIEKLWGNLKKLRRRTGASVNDLLRMSDCSWD